MSANMRNFYAGGNTSQGFFSLYQSIIQGLDRLFILKGAPGTGKSSLVKDLAETMLENKFDVELIHSPEDNDSLDGLIIPDLKVGIVNGNPPYSLDPKYPNVVDEIIDFGVYVNSNILWKDKEEIVSLINKKEEAYQMTFKHFNQAKQIHFDREKIYVQEMNKEKANEVTDQVIQQIFTHRTLQGKAMQRHLFFGAATPKGVVHYIDNLTQDLETRIIIKGRSGSGKSTMLKKLVQAADQRGYDCEVYHCGFDPNSLDMVIIPQMKIAILDGTAPHPIDPSRDGDEVLDMYALCFTKDVDQENAEFLKENALRYKQEIKQGVEFLAKAKSYNDNLEKFYIEAMDFSQLDKVKENILRKIKG